MFDIFGVNEAGVFVIQKQVKIHNIKFKRSESSRMGTLGCSCLTGNWLWIRPLAAGICGTN